MRTKPPPRHWSTFANYDMPAANDVCGPGLDQQTDLDIPDDGDDMAFGLEETIACYSLRRKTDGEWMFKVGAV